MNRLSRWADLRPRILSAVVMLAIGFFAIWAGGMVFNVVIAAVCGGILWELSGMLWQGQSIRSLKFGLLGAVSLIVASITPIWLAICVLALPTIVGLREAKGDTQKKFLIFSIWIMCAALGFVFLRNSYGTGVLLWLVSVVIATDVVGYFAGKIIGGPKFWPRISPKKTWSGTASGWIAAAGVGMAFAAPLNMGGTLVLLSIVISMASQAGDVAESALKRQTGVKDSSDIIPGHGGLFDRFDGMLGASAVFLLIAALWGL